LEHPINNPDAALLLIGTELTTGKIQDTHGKYLSSLLTERGFHVTSVTMVPDGLGIRREVKRLLAETDLLVVTGGLGPTSDDVTRDAIAQAADAPLEFHEESWQSIREMFGPNEPPKSNRRQADIPAGFEAITNTCGTAPGFWGEVDGTTVVALPGPPRELQAMTRTFFEGFLAGRSGSPNRPVTTATTFLISESGLEDYLLQIADGSDEWHTRAEGDRIVVDIESSRDGGRVLDLLSRKFGRMCVRAGETSACQVLSAALLESGLRLVCAESCTGGLIGKMMTDLPGSSSVFWGGYTTYANDAKERMLSVSSLSQHGAVSRETVIEMASGAIARSGAGVSIAVSGIAGPEGGTPAKPVGTVWIGVKMKGGDANAWEFRFRGDRDRVRLKSAVASMLLAEASIQGVGVDNEPFWAYI
jgi:nicotinamide-nucleotide amidase